MPTASLFSSTKRKQTRFQTKNQKYKRNNKTLKCPLDNSTVGSLFCSHKLQSTFSKRTSLSFLCYCTSCRVMPSRVVPFRLVSSRVVSSYRQLNINFILHYNTSSKKDLPLNILTKEKYFSSVNRQVGSSFRYILSTVATQ